MKVGWRENTGSAVSLFLLATLACGAWLLATVTEFNTKGGGREAANEVSSVIEGAVITRTDKAGHPVQTLRAERIQQYNGGSALLSRPTISQFRPDHAPLNIVADLASVSDDQEEVGLKGNVVLTRSAFRGQAAVEVQTSSLTYLVKAEVATTLEPVKITRGDSTLHGIGMKANHGENRFEIIAGTNMVLPADATQSTIGRSKP